MAIRVGIFGAGSRGRQCFETVAGDTRFVVECFFDNDPAKWGAAVDGVSIRQPTAEACASVDAVLLASVYGRDILAQLLRLGAGSRVAVSPTDLVRRFAGGTPPRADTAPSNAERRDAFLRATPADVLGIADRLDAVEFPRTLDTAWADYAACTICCNNYLAFADVLSRSFLRQHPRGRFFICLADTKRDDIVYPDDPRVSIVTADSLGIPAFESFAFKYDVLELNTAVKPYLLEHLLRREHARRLLYLDPDILVLGSLDALYDRLSWTPLVLTPHITTPYSDDRQPREVDLLRSGTFNLGFIGIAAHEQTDRLLAWWQERLYDHCTREVEKGLFVDQKWMDLVPALFPAHEVVRDPAFNVAYWNLHERQVTRDGDTFRVNGRPLAFFHFSGVDVDDLEAVSKYQNRFTLPECGALRDLFHLYRALVVRHDHLDQKPLRYAYSAFADGTRVPDVVRQVYRDQRLGGRFPRPFDVSAGSYFGWLTTPSQPGALVSNLLLAIHARHADVRAVYPDVHGAHETGFLLYMLTAAELYGLPPALVDLDPDLLTARATSDAMPERKAS